jgi:hypothetical protein
MGDTIYMFSDDAVTPIMDIAPGETQFQNFFSYHKRTNELYPLYNYYNSEYYLSQTFTLLDNSNPIKFISGHFKMNILNIFDRLYIHFNMYDVYGHQLISVKIFKGILMCLLFLHLKFYNNIFTFLNLKKISINVFTFTCNLKRTCIKNK